MLTDFRNALESKKQEIAKSKGKELVDPSQHTDSVSVKENENLSSLLHALSEIGSTYVEDWFVRSKIFGKQINLHIRLPSPGFFFLEYGTPFVLYSLALPPKPGTAVEHLTSKQVFERQVRTCCVAIVKPKLTIEFLSKLPRYFIQRLYAVIIDLTAPENLIFLIRAFLNKISDSKGKMQLLELYIMACKNSKSPVQYLFPRVANPHLLNALEHLIFDIGWEYDRNNKEAELKAMATGGMRRGLFG